MRYIWFIIVVNLIVLALGALAVILLKTLNKPWWQERWIRISTFLLPVTAVVSLISFIVAYSKGVQDIAYPAAVIAVLLIMFEVALVLSLPISGLIHIAHRSYSKSKPSPPEPDNDKVNFGRRSFIKGTAAAFPVVSLGYAGFGVGRSFGTAEVTEQTFRFKDLPGDLDGVRILHLSDLHLRQYVNLDDLEEVLIDAEPHQPHLTVVTGDIADDLNQLKDALRMIDNLKSPLGTFATLGNHEYFRGVDTVRRIFSQSTVPLLIDEGAKVTVGASQMFIAGIDDPRRMRARNEAFFRRTIDQTMENHSGEDFTLLLSHRPDALDHASEVGIDLTLAGHTHGGQFGIAGRSAFESVWPERYLWGKYERNGSQLYTSSGVGHWFPFRLGCPPEAPIITLRRA